MKKRIVALLLGVCMVATILVGCGGSASTDTEQKTESSSNEQGTEQGTEQSTEQEVDVSKSYHAIDQIVTTDGAQVDIEELFYQYVTGCGQGGHYYADYANFFASENSTEGKEALKKLYDLYNATYPEYRNGNLVVDRLAFSISYDGENYQLINNKDMFDSLENTRTAVLFKVTLNPSETAKDCKSFTTNVIVVLEKGREHNSTSDEWESIVGWYSLDSLGKYFPGYNLEQ